MGIEDLIEIILILWFWRISLIEERGLFYDIRIMGSFIGLIIFMEVVMDLNWVEE